MLLTRLSFPFEIKLAAEKTNVNSNENMRPREFFDNFVSSKRPSPRTCFYPQLWNSYPTVIVDSNSPLFLPFHSKIIIKLLYLTLTDVRTL